MRNIDRTEDGKMLIRKGKTGDIKRVAEIYDNIITEEENGRANVGWVRGVYPTEQTALDALNANELFVMEDNGEVVAAAKINKIQVPEYANADWKRKDAPDDKIMVLHTLVVDRSASGKGAARRL